jgi:hypothetical protein
MIYVDELRSWPQQAKPGAERYFGNGKKSCHMYADSIPELIAFAERLGLKRIWFQAEHGGHFDLTPPKRAQAIRLGATTIRAEDRARERLAASVPSEQTKKTVDYSKCPNCGGSLVLIDGWAEYGDQTVEIQRLGCWICGYAVSEDDDE